MTSPRSSKPAKNTAATPAGNAIETEVFKPARDHILAIALLSAIVLLMVGWAPQYLVWLLIIPVLAVWWVLKARTRVSEEGIAITYAFRGNKSIAWKDLAGIGFRKAHAFARTQSGEEFKLPGVTFNSLPRLEGASRGRIPDALTAGQEAADDKVAIIHRDGQQILLTKEEYEEYLQKHPELAAQQDKPASESKAPKPTDSKE